MDNNFIDILVPMGICVVLPIMIVWLITRKQQNETNRKTEIMLKAIETGQKIDSEFFSIQKKASKSIKERLWDRLVIAWMTTIFAITHAIFGTSIYIGDLKLDRSLFDCIFLAIGISFFISYYVGKKIFKKEMEAEAESEAQAGSEAEAEAEAETKTIEQK
ncbi:MAG: hypothetical protein IIX13_08565 [Bacteroidales bacterium]|nr:hypothetical protein [Bacteroidales bacterium]